LRTRFSGALPLHTSTEEPSIVVDADGAEGLTSRAADSIQEHGLRSC
jgi:hypothetical protein